MKTEPPETIITPEEITPTTIQRAMQRWLGEKSRYDVLYRYYLGDMDFAEIHDDGNRVVANFCRYISMALRGYMVGNLPKYVAREDDPYGQAIIDLMRRQNEDIVDSQIALDMSRYGKAFELVYLPKGKNEPASVPVSPRNAFVAYAGDMERDSVFGAVVYTHTDDSQTTIYTLYLYTREDARTYTSKSESGPWQLIEGPTPHGFGRVPLIEYRNNLECLGDYEGILDLQDAYNALLSDRQDDKDAFAQTMLYIQGSLIGTTAEQIEEGKKFLKEHKVIQGDEDTTVTWLTKTMDESGIQVLQDQYASDIHKFAMVPDLSDEQFAGNASGIAMAYKMFGTDQMMAEKVARFRQGFRRRVKLYDHALNNPTNSEGYTPRADLEHTDIIFQFNAPQDLSYMATALTQLTASGIMSKATARRQLAVIPDPVEEAELVDEEESAQGDVYQQSFEDDFTGSLGRADQAAPEGDDGQR